MFNRVIRLPFTLLRIPVQLDWSFLIILPLLAFMIGSRVLVFADLFDLPEARSLTTGATPYVLGLIAAIGLFVGVVLHEFGHAVAARAYGVKVRSITLWFLGGVADFEEMPRQRGAEAVVAIVGPVVSVALAAVCWLALQAIPTGAIAVRFVLAYLAYMNLILAIFNLIPALPLDGGRVLRSLLALKLPHARATEIAGRVSKVFALFLGLVGIMYLNFFLLLIAIFIYMAGAGETHASRAEELLRGVRVREVMNPEVRSVPPDLRVSELMQHMLRERHLGFPVIDEAGGVLGLVSVDDAQDKDPDLPVAQIMKRDIPTIPQDEQMVEAFRAMARNGFGRLIVTDRAGRMAGILTKTDLMRLLRVRTMGPEVPDLLEQPDSASPVMEPRGASVVSGRTA